MFEEIKAREEYKSPELRVIVLANPVCINEQSYTLGGQGTTEGMEEENLVW